MTDRDLAEIMLRAQDSHWRLMIEALELIANGADPDAVDRILDPALDDVREVVEVALDEYLGPRFRSPWTRSTPRRGER